MIVIVVEESALGHDSMPLLARGDDSPPLKLPLLVLHSTLFYFTLLLHSPLFHCFYIRSMITRISI